MAISIRLRVPGTNWWLVATPTDGPEWDITVMDHLAEPPTGPEAYIQARAWLLTAITDLQEQLVRELAQLKNITGEDRS